MTIYINSMGAYTDEVRYSKVSDETRIYCERCGRTWSTDEDGSTLILCPTNGLPNMHHLCPVCTAKIARVLEGAD